jgi:hypothetical protein
MKAANSISWRWTTFYTVRQKTAVTVVEHSAFEDRRQCAAYDGFYARGAVSIYDAYQSRAPNVDDLLVDPRATYGRLGVLKGPMSCIPSGSVSVLR